MQGQGSTSNSFADAQNFFLDHEHNANSPELDQLNAVPPSASVHGGHPVMRWMGESSSNMNAPNQHRSLTFQELLIEDGWPSSPEADDRNDQSFRQRHSGPNIAPLQEIVNTNLSNGQLAIGQPILLGTCSGTFPHNIILDTAFGGNGTDSNLNLGAESINPIAEGGLEADQNPPTSNSSDPVIISSGVARYVLEDYGDIDVSVVGRRLSCKRRAPEDASGQSSLGESSSSVHPTGNSQHVVTAQENAGNIYYISNTLNNHPNDSHSEHSEFVILPDIGLTPVMHQPSTVAGSRVGAGAGEASDMHASSIIAGEAENSQRNNRLKRTANQQEFVVSNSTTWTTGNSHVQLPSQTNTYFPFDRFPNASSAAAVHATSTMQSLLQVSDSTMQSLLQPSQWNGVSWPRAGVSSGSNSYIANGGNVFHQNENLRNNLKNSMLPPEFERGNMVHMRTNLNFSNWNGNFPGFIASSSRNSSGSGVNPSTAPTWFPQRNLAEDYEQRVSEIMNRSESQGQVNFFRTNYATSAAARAMEFSVKGGDAGPSRIPQRSGLMPGLGRQAGRRLEIGPALRSLTAARRRNRLLSENAMGPDPSEWLATGARLHDAHQDMRLDVDNMTYEELLALGEHIGNVPTGLSEDAIMSHLRRQNYQLTTARSPMEDDACCICQEDFAEGEDLGKLNCGHDFHVNCIKQWLVLKNICPICKMTALAVKNR